MIYEKTVAIREKYTLTFNLKCPVCMDNENPVHYKNGEW